MVESARPSGPERVGLRHARDDDGNENRRDHETASGIAKRRRRSSSSRRFRVRPPPRSRRGAGASEAAVNEPVRDQPARPRGWRRSATTGRECRCRSRRATDRDPAGTRPPSRARNRWREPRSRRAGCASTAPESQRAEDQQRPYEIELLLDRERPGVFQGRGRRELLEVRLMREDLGPVGSVGERRETVTSQLVQLDR